MGRSTKIIVIIFTTVLIHILLTGVVSARQIEVTGSVVNIRSGPATTYDVLTQVRAGDRFAVMGSRQEWLEIELDDQRHGWIAGWLTGEVAVGEKPAAGAQDEEISSPGVVVVTGSVVNVRFGPSTEEKIIGQVKQGTRLTALGQLEGWYQVRLPDGGSGYLADWLGELYREEAGVGEKAAADLGQFLAVRQGVILYAGPSDEFPRITTIIEGQQVKLLSSAGDWWEVELDDGRTGWLNRGAVADRGQEHRRQDAGERPMEPQRVFDLAVDESAGRVMISVSSTSQLNYQLMSLDSPYRLVVDLPGQYLRMAEGERRVEMSNDLVEKVRLGQFEGDTVRVVLDLKGRVRYSLDYLDDGKTVRIKIEPPSLAGQVIVIDPGHGSSTSWGAADPGAIGSNGVYESKVVLAIAKKAAGLLKGTGAQVILTREGEANLSLWERAEIANNINADVFVSIHANSSPSRRLKGSATFFYAPRRSGLSGQRNERYRLADFIQDELVDSAGTHDLGVREENFSVLRNSQVPSALVETAFISNPQEELLLVDAAFLEKVAVGIARGIERYLLEK